MKTEGILFKTPCAVVVGKKNDQVVFGEVVSILTTESRITFHIKAYTNVEYSHHLHSYVVFRQHHPSMYLIDHDRIHDIHPYGLYSSPNNRTLQYIVLRNIII